MGAGCIPDFWRQEARASESMRGKTGGINQSMFGFILGFLTGVYLYTQWLIREVKNENKEDDV